MEAREEPRDPGYDDWFDEPELPTETHSGVNRGVQEDVEEVWVLPEEEDGHPGAQREFVIGGRTLTTTQVAIIGLCALAVIFAILAAFGVFNGSKAAVPTPQVTQKLVTVTVQATTAAKAPSVQAPSQTLKLGDTGAQVKALQQSLASLGYSVGTPDGDYGPSTQAAVQKFQAAHNLQPDGTVGPLTLAALQKAVSG